MIITSLFVVSTMELFSMGTQECYAYTVMRKLETKRAYKIEAQKIVALTFMLYLLVGLSHILLFLEIEKSKLKKSQALFLRAIIYKVFL